MRRKSDGALNMTLLIREKFNDEKTARDFGLPEYDLTVNIYPDDIKNIRYDMVISEGEDVSCIILSEDLGV